MVEKARLRHLDIGLQSTKVGQGYSWFVKFMRIALPLTAILLIFTAFIIPKMKDKMVIVPKETLIDQSQTNIGENELINPNFETVDSYQHPIKVTAERAIQNQENPNLLKLEKPIADLQMKNGSKIHINALNGSYEQETQKLYLKNDVNIQHESGYNLHAQELRVDMKTKQAFSDKNVTIDGPAATINAIGLEGNVDEGKLIFKGPATLILKSGMDTAINKEN